MARNLRRENLSFFKHLTGPLRLLTSYLRVESSKKPVNIGSLRVYGSNHPLTVRVRLWPSWLWAQDAFSVQGARGSPRVEARAFGSGMEQPIKPIACWWG